MAVIVQVNIRSSRNFSFAGSLVFLAIYTVCSLGGFTVVVSVGGIIAAAQLLICH
jgi:hypothetical protein